MTGEYITYLVAFIIFAWVMVVVIGISSLEDNKRYFGKKYNNQSYIRWIFWPVTLVLMIPLIIWIIVKFIGQYLVGIAQVYKEKK